MASEAPEAPADERCQIVRRLLRLAGPVTGAYALEGVATLVPFWAAAHLGSPDAEEATRRVGAVGLGSSVLAVFCHTFAAGWAGAQDTLVSQAYGEEDDKKARDYLHCCLVWMLLFAAAASVLLWQTEALLLWLGCASEQIAADTARHVIASIPGACFTFQYDSLRKFLMNQQISSPGFWVLVATVPCHLAMSVLLLEWSSIDPVVSLGIAFSVKSAVSFFLLGGYMSWFHVTPSCVGWWRIWQSSAFTWKGLLSYAAIGVPNVAMVGFDWWAFELLTLLAGGLQSQSELAAHVAMATVSNWTFLLSRGVSKAATALVGAATGQKDLAQVSSTLKAGTQLTAAMCGMIVACCWVGRGQLALGLLSDEAASQEAFMRAFPFMLLQILADGANSLFSGVFAAFGRQGAVSIGLFTCQWVVQLTGAWQLG
ncbi:DTX37, partial [Symbiodinium natans]